FGGIVAYEMSLQLASYGHSPKGLVLIDSPCPNRDITLSETLVTYLMSRLPANETKIAPSIIQRQFTLSSALLQAYVPHPIGNVCPPMILLKSATGFTCAALTKKDIPSWLTERYSSDIGALGWELMPHCKVEVHMIPGHHFEAFDSLY
ncbi:unnamed protein product, partial [Mycena citricolor]